MAMERIKAVVNQILNRLHAVRGKGEEATKQSLVLPMLDALGFDIWNPAEVCPEYDSDFAIKKLGQKEKVDLAILWEGVPRVYIEVKSVDISLDGHEGQLARYFNATPSVSLAILTNGIEYRFFTDTGEPNIMDPSPFHIVKLDGVDQGIEILARFHKSVFSPGVIRDFATELNYTAKISKFLRAELDLRERNPSEKFVRWVLAEEASYTGRITANIIERFQPIIKNALQIVLRDIVRRSVAALDKEVVSPLSQEVVQPSQNSVIQKAETSEAAEPPDESSSDTAIGENKLRLFDMIKAILDASEFAKAEIYDSRTRKNIPVELSCKDTSGYFSIYFNKPSFWIIRAVTESRNPWIGFNVKTDISNQLIPTDFRRFLEHPYAEFRVGINNIEDINALSRLALAAFQKTIEDRRREPEKTE